MPNSQEFSAQEFNTQEDNGHVFSDDVPAVYGALKCYFFTPKRGDIWGAFCFLFDGATGEHMENVFWATRTLVGPAIDVDMPWKSLNKVIPQMGVYEKSLGDKLSVLMLESFSSAARVDLCRSTDIPDKLLAISNEIRSVFERTTHCFLEFRMAFECMSKQELANAGVLTKESSTLEPEADKTEPNKKALSGALLNCQPIIDPVHGKPVSELKPGDMVEVKIQGGVGAGELFHKYLASTNQEAIFPVESLEKGDADKIYIFLNINEEIMGVITVNKDLRLRVLQTKSAKKTSISVNMDNVIFFGILASAAVVIALVVKFLLL